MFRKCFAMKSEFLRGAQRKEIPIRVMQQWNHTKRFDDEYLAGKFFDQKICSLLRDIAISNNRRHQSLLALNTARQARDKPPRTAAGSREKKMQKTILTIAGSALIALST